MNNRIESLFIGHGAPTYALNPGRPGKALAAIGKQLIEQNTTALIVLSPHWRSAQLAATSHVAPMIVHDFHGFPGELYSLQPEISGVPEVATRLAAALADQKLTIELRPHQGFDHGAWVPYIHLFPHGGIPMIQLSMPVNWTGETAMNVGELVGKFARNCNAVVVGSGSLTHNFQDMRLHGDNAHDSIPTYVTEFTNWVTEQLRLGNRTAIARAQFSAPHFARAHPDDDHYLPLPFAMGAASHNFKVSVLPEDVRYSALSMQSFAFLN